MLKLKDIQILFNRKLELYTVHAQKRMAERRITSDEIRQAVLSSEADIIEQYPDDKYAPSCLIYGETDMKRNLHVQVNCRAVVITVYEPEVIFWQNGFKQRRK